MMIALMAIALALRSDTVAVAPHDTLYALEGTRELLAEWQPDRTRAFCVTRYLQNGGVVVLLAMEPMRRPEPGSAPCGTLPVWIQDASCELDAIDRATFTTVNRAWVKKQCVPEGYVTYPNVGPGRAA